MITSAFAYITVLMLIAGALALLEEKTRWKLFAYLPAIVLLYFTVILLSTFGLWQKTEAINGIYQQLKINLLPAMIFLMLLKADLRKIRKLGSKMLLAFFAASLSIGVAFTLAFALFHTYLQSGAWKTLAALSGSWMGGTGNMAAIQLALNVPDASMGYTLLIDSIDYALWVMFLLALVPFANTFNRWVGADNKVLETLSKSLDTEADGASSESNLKPGTQLLLLVAAAMGVSVFAQWLGALLPISDFFSLTAWTVLIITLCGVVAAMTPLSKLRGSDELSGVLLYLMIALIASRSSFAQLTEAPIYILLGLVILLLHGLMMVAVAKVFKLDLFTCGIASLANIGGVASAPILAAAYSRALIPIGVLMAMLGYIVGTGGGLLVGRVLFWVSSH
jgi:uncharacterized membrane protein